MGARQRPFYRIVVMDSRAPRDGRPIEEIGHYSVVLPTKDRVTIALDRVKYWVERGAKMSETVRRLVARASQESQ